MRAFLSILAVASSVGVMTASCGETDSSSPARAEPDASLDASGVTKDSAAPDGGAGIDSAVNPGKDAAVSDAGSDALDASDSASADAFDATDAALPDGLSTPIPYKSFADSPFQNLVFPSYFHLEDWEDGLVNTPGVTPSSTQLGTSFGASLVDSVDGDDGAVDGTCEKDAGGCESGFANGTIDFTFDAVALGALPTHVGIVWTDGSPGCDAIFEAYDAADVLIGTMTATGVGDNSNLGSVDEDRFFSVVHAAGVKKIVVTSSSGGVEVDHLQYGR
jgi:hypothetical protein